MSGKLTAIAGCCLTFPYLLHAQVPPIYVPPDVQQERLIHNVRPVYPELAKQAHIQGTVRLAALIGEDGMVERLRLISGHPFLVKATFDAVKQWRYRPATYHGVPVAVFTIIEVSFNMEYGEPVALTGGESGIRYLDALLESISCRFPVAAAAINARNAVRHCPPLPTALSGIVPRS